MSQHGFNRCMWWQSLIGWPNGPSDEGTLKCLDRWGRAEPNRGGEDDDGFSTMNLGGGSKNRTIQSDFATKNIDVSAGGASRLDTRQARKPLWDNDKSEPKSIGIIPIVIIGAAAYYILFRK